MTERIEAIPFKEPSPQLFELLRLLAEVHQDLYRVCQFEFQHEELYALTELIPIQVDRLLTRGRL